MGQSEPFFCESFNQQQIEMMERAIERAWDVIRHTDHIAEPDARKLLALCVMAEARTGEENHIRLVNKAVVSFRAQRAHETIETRKRV
jgi:hypothetical protein